MKVVLLKSRAKHAGGLEKVARRIGDGFRARGAEVVELSPGNEWPKFRRIGKFDRTVESYLRDHPADIVFGMDRNKTQTHFRAGNGSHRAFIESRLLSEGRLKYLSCLLNPLHRKILSNEKLAFESPALKKLFVNSHMVERQILETYATDPKKIAVIHNGVEWSEMEAKPKAGPFRFLFIGNGFTRKGLGPLLRGLSLFQNPPELWVVGQDKRMSHYQKMAAGLPVRFFGAQNVRPLYEQADALVIPSFYDPFANVTVEALAMGLYVVSSKFNGGAEILTPETGSIIENLLSPESIAASLQTAMQHPKTAAQAQKCRASVEHLDYSQQLNRLLDACYR
jgi:UDP-glucose:(heptosyl)LPS alpha-1,3-glucosyltransferase